MDRRKDRKEERKLERKIERNAVKKREGEIGENFDDKRSERGLE